jgi:hypothetical protein
VRVGWSGTASRFSCGRSSSRGALGQFWGYGG